MERGKRAAVLGATGPMGRGLVAELCRRGVQARAVSRSDINLLRDFGSLGVECVAADLRDAAAATRAADGCDVVFLCAGLPLRDYTQHADIGRAVAQAMRTTGARGVLVSGYWSFGAGAPVPIDEQTPRRPRDKRAKARLEQEQTMQGAGAAVAILPDFYGPGAHGVLNSALESIARGESARWFSGLRTPREFVYLPDLFAPLVDLSERQEAMGDRWVIAGAGATCAAEIGAIASAALGFGAEFRPTPRWKVALASLADSAARVFLPLAAIYSKPAFFDDAKFRAAFPGHAVTPYTRGIAATLESIRGCAAAAPAASRVA